MKRLLFIIPLLLSSCGGEEDFRGFSFSIDTETNLCFVGEAYTNILFQKRVRHFAHVPCTPEVVMLAMAEGRLLKRKRFNFAKLKEN